MRIADNPTEIVDGEEVFPLSKDLVVKFAQEESKLAGIMYTPIEEKILRQVANYLLFRSFSLLKKGGEKKCAITLYNVALDVLKGASLEIDGEWKRIEEIIDAAQEDQDIMAFMRNATNDFQRRFEYQNTLITNQFDLSHQDRKEIRAELRFINSQLKKSGSWTGRGLVAIMLALSLLFFTATISGLVIYRLFIPGSDIGISSNLDPTNLAATR